MSALTQRNRTLGELITELRARLGFMAQGPSANNNRDTLKSFLSEAHDYVYEELKPTPSRKKTQITLETGSQVYDWHNDIEDEDIDPANVISVWLAPSSTERNKMVQGISEAHRADISRGRPERYDTIGGQCEVWPVPDMSYQMVVEYTESKPLFSADSHRPGVPDRLVFLYALAQAKAHYRHPDAQVPGASFNKMLALAKAGQHENRRYVVNKQDTIERTVMVSDGVHTLKVD